MQNEQSQGRIPRRKEDEVPDEVKTMFQGCRLSIKKQREVLGTAALTFQN